VAAEADVRAALAVETIARSRFSFAQQAPNLRFMENQRAAVGRKLSDPDFQSSLVNKSLGLVMGLSLLLAAFVAHDGYIWANPPTPKYFIVDGEHAPRPVAALDSPIVNDAQLLDWTVKWASAPYNVNYHDYPEELNTAGRRFTLNGWRTFAESYIKSGNYEAMKQGMMLCFAQAQRAAVIVETTIRAGALAYRIQFPILQTCQNSQQANTQKMILTALVVRTNDEDHRDGIAIDQLVAEAR
jgi:intracellular multiplication protein IcmL